MCFDLVDLNMNCEKVSGVDRYLFYNWHKEDHTGLFIYSLSSSVIKLIMSGVNLHANLLV